MRRENVGASAPTGQSRPVVLDGYPDQCPRCHAKLVPRYVGTFARTLAKESDVEEVFQCTSAQCGGLFIAVFKPTALPNNPPWYKFTRSIPLEAEAPQVSDLVRSVSAAFFETYSQALVSESLGLTQLTGIGLRKALEFLVKDFAIQEHPGEAEAIKKKALAACIADYLTDPGTKEMAKRAAWIGNDETHYIRKWEDKDVSDLKVLLRLTMNGIENVLLTKKYIAEMPSGS